MRIVSFTGTKRGMSLRQKDTFVEELIRLESEGFGILVHGGCKGADENAHLIAMTRGWKLKVYPSDKKEWHGYLTGEFELMPEEDPLKRNPKIVRDGELLIACPYQIFEITRSGTWTTIRHARRQKKEIRILHP